MNRRQVLNIGGAGLALSLGVGAVAEEPKMPYVRIAELEIDPAQLDAYKASVKEEMAASKERMYREALPWLFEPAPKTAPPPHVPPAGGLNAGEESGG